MGEQITLNVPGNVVQQARRVASQTDRPVEQVLVDWLNRAAPESHTAALPESEAALLQQINLGLSESDWQRYHALLDKRRAETLTAGERQELVSLSDRIEEANARRVSGLVELARIRDTPLETLMTDLGISMPKYD